jgi:hypothetical protein
VRVDVWLAASTGDDAINKPAITASDRILVIVTSLFLRLVRSIRGRVFRSRSDPNNGMRFVADGSFISDEPFISCSFRQSVAAVASPIIQTNCAERTASGDSTGDTQCR